MRQAGLTLVEMMVVLLIASMAITLGFQSLGQWRRADAAITGITGQARQLTLTRSWLEESLRSLTPVDPQPDPSSFTSAGDGTFKGQRLQLSGTSLNGVLAPRGGSLAILWEIETDGQGVRLNLTEQGNALTLPLPQVREAFFTYGDREGRQHEQWPPALGMNDQLPASIALHLENLDGNQRVWAAPIVGISNPIRRLYEQTDD